eukprot:comp19221_c0_seq1/m.21982 comp19221_c0_seq1/g.21982  ORF comp19221_c0_seq1/g.21982 comp19221_c0_seq1/m.21982 type:complete len:128 (-) comp19221_c0_seq1:367-750(-)
MLSRAVKEHQIKQSNLRDRNDKLRKEALASVEAVSHGMVDSLNGTVAEIFQNQRQLELETKNVTALTAKFSKQASQWITMMESFNQALKEIGDVENWSRVIETDMRVVAGVLEHTQKNEKTPVPSQS